MAAESTAVLRRTIRRWTQARSMVSSAAPALGIYAAIRLTGVMVVAMCAWASGKKPSAVLGLSWDGHWYAGIAQNGYGEIVQSQHPGMSYSDLVFFPLFPGLERAAGVLLPVSLVKAGLLVAGLSALVAAWGIYAVGEHLYGRKTGTWLVILWGLLPNAVVQSMAYTEALMTAFAAWSLYCALTGRWISAASLALLAGLVRPNGIAVALAVACAAAHTLWRHPLSRGALRIWVTPAVAPAGWLGYVAWVGMRTGTPLGYFRIQRGWGSRFDFGRYNLKYLQELFFRSGRLSHFVAAAVVIIALFCLLLFLLDRPPLPLVVYSVVLMTAALGGADYFTAKPRLLLPAFPLLIPAALALSRARRRTAVTLLSGCAGFSFLYGTYLVMFAHTAP